MRGVDAVLASVLILLISITAIFLALQLGGPATQKTQEILLMQEGKSNLISIDNAVRSVLAEGEGSVRVLRFSILGGEYKIDNSSDSIQFSMESRSQIIAEGVSKAENGINFTGSAGMVYLNLTYENIQITGEGDFGRGYHTLTIRNNGFNDTTQKQMIYISLTPPVPTTVTTFTGQYNQAQTFVFKGVNTTSPNNLNDLGINYYNITEGSESGGQHNYFQDNTQNITGFNTTSTYYTSALDSQNYNVTSTVGQSGGTTIKQYNQTQTIVVAGANTTSPNSLNMVDGQTYNVTEGGTTTSESDTSSDLQSGAIQNRGVISSWTNTFSGYQNPTQNLAIGTGWTNPANAYTSDNQYAQGASSVNHSYYGFGFALPLDAIVSGIWLMLDANASIATGVQQIRVEVSNDSGSTWSNTGDVTVDMPITEQTYTFGGDADLWGRSFTPTTVNSNFRVRVTASTSSASRYDRLDWLRANISYRNPVYDTEANKTPTTYNNVYPGPVLDSITDISVTVNISSYNKTGSSGKNSLPDLWLELSNGASTWFEAGNMGINSAGNFTIFTTDATTLAYWLNNPTQRNIRIKGRYFDANRTTWDEINYTDVWIKIDSKKTTYRAEVEHNATGVNWLGALTSINVSLNFSTNATSDFNLAIYNFGSGIWNYTTCQGGTAVAGNWYNWWCNVTNSPSYYNSSDGKIRVRLNGTSHASLAILREEYVQYYVTNTTPTLYANISVEHNSSAISEDPLAITKINITTVLKTNISSGIPFNFYIYNFSSLSWEPCVQISIGTLYNKIECIRTTNPSYYISNGKIRIRLNSSGDTITHQMMEDYLIYQVTMPNEYRTEVEHNATGVGWSGTLDNVSISLNFSTNSTNSPTFNFLVYNFISGNWEICDTLNPLANTWYMRWCNETTSPGNYLSGGKIRIRLNETAHQNLAEVKEDYVQYYVTHTQ